MQDDLFQAPADDDGTVSVADILALSPLRARMVPVPEEGVLVLSWPAVIPGEQLAALQRVLGQLRARLGRPDLLVLAVEAGAQLQALDDAQLARLGLQRASAREHQSEG